MRIRSCPVPSMRSVPRHANVLISVSLILWLGAPTPTLAQVNTDERAVTGVVSDVLRAFVAKHTGAPPGRLVLDTTLHFMAHSGDPYSEAEPFPSGERRALADDLDWGIGSYPEVVECEERCLLRDNLLLLNVSRPTIRGDTAVVSFSWHHNYRGVVRENRRVVEMIRTSGQQWKVVDVVGCIRSTAGGPCNLPRLEPR